MPDYTDDDEEERRRLEAFGYGADGAPVDALDPAAAMAQAPADVDFAPSMFAQQQQMPAMQSMSDDDVMQAFTAPTPSSNAEAPPEMEPRNDTWLAIAAGLDMLLNRGENAGAFLGQLAQPDNSDYVNWQRRNEAANDASMRDSRALMAQARMQPRQQSQRDTLSRERWEAEQRQKAALNSLDSPETQQWRKAAIAAGIVDEQTASQMTAEQLKALRPQLGQAVAQDRGFGYASQGREQSDTLARRRMALADKYASNRITYRDYLQQQRMMDADEMHDEDREEQAAVAASQAVGADQRKRAANLEKERATLESVLARLRARDQSDSLPAQGHFIERGIINLRKSAAGGTGMNQEDSQLDNDLTTAGLQSYITEAGNAPNSEREQDTAGRKFRGDGTVGGSIAAIEAHLAKVAAAEEAMRARENESIPAVAPRARRQARPRPRSEMHAPAKPRPAAGQTRGTQLSKEEQDELDSLGGF